MFNKDGQDRDRIVILIKLIKFDSALTFQHGICTILNFTMAEQDNNNDTEDRYSNGKLLSA